MTDINDPRQLPTPPTGDSGDEPDFGGGQPGDPATEDLPIGLRVGRNPANLGDEVPDSTDVTFPNAEPLPAEM